MYDLIAILINGFLEFTKENSPLISILTFLLGLLIGHRFHIYRDKRKEFNNLISPIRSSLIAAKANPHIHATLNEESIADIRAELPAWKRSGFDTALKQYFISKSEENQTRDNYGGVLYIDEQAIKNSIIILLKYIKKK